jgi:hypothetical protein
VEPFVLFACCCGCCGLPPHSSSNTTIYNYSLTHQRTQIKDDSEKTSSVGGRGVIVADMLWFHDEDAYAKSYMQDAKHNL